MTICFSYFLALPQLYLYFYLAVLYYTYHYLCSDFYSILHRLSCCSLVFFCTTKCLLTHIYYHLYLFGFRLSHICLPPSLGKEIVGLKIKEILNSTYKILLFHFIVCLFYLKGTSAS